MNYYNIDQHYLLAFQRASLSKKFVYLCENKFLRKTISTCLSGAQMGSIYEKSLYTAPLRFKLFRELFFSIFDWKARFFYVNEGI